MSPLIPTYNGNGPFVPVVMYKRHRYPVGEALDSAEDALRVAFEVAVSLRDEMHPSVPEGYRF